MQPRRTSSSALLLSLVFPQLTLFNWYAFDKEVALGKNEAQRFDQSVKLLEDPVVSEYINRLGQTLARNSNARMP